ncbi:MAG TPA: four helix bundle protein [Armatimonadota bacterium]|jgi:four helix bundle protein
MAVKSYRDLEVWQKSMDLTVDCYRITGQFPKSETYGLASQLQRAAVSIPSNIAEGATRQHTTEFIQFLSVASASLAELETQIEIASRLEYVDSKKAQAIFERTKELGRMLSGLIRVLREKKNASQ